MTDPQPRKRQRSLVRAIWAFFDAGDPVNKKTYVRWATCIFCKSSLQGQSSTMCGHLVKCERASLEAKQTAKYELSTSRERRRKRLSSQQMTFSSGRLPPWTKKEQVKFNSLLLEAAISGAWSFRSITSPAAKAVFNLLRPNASIPSRGVLSGSVLQEEAD